MSENNKKHWVLNKMLNKIIVGKNRKSRMFCTVLIVELFNSLSDKH
jgi:hypothetical protein